MKREAPAVCWWCRFEIPASPYADIPATCCKGEACVKAEQRYRRQLHAMTRAQKLDHVEIIRNEKLT